jgi:guanine deaminase
MAQRLKIVGGLVLRDARQPARLEDILIEDGRITALVPPGGLQGLPADRLIDASDRLVMPGLVNAHSHSHGTLGRGAVPDVALEGFLAASPSINGQRGLEDLALSATLTAVELLKKGCTAVFDMAAEGPGPSLAGLHAVAGAYAATGIRAVVAPMMADRTLYQAYPDLLAGLPSDLQAAMAVLRAADAADCLAVVRAAALDWPFDPAQVRLGVAPTIPLHCSDTFLQGCAALSAEFGLPLQTHLAESQLQAVHGARRYGRSLVAHLHALGVLGERMSVSHAIWIDEQDMAMLARAGVTAVHNPLSNLRLGSGIAAVRAMLDQGLRVALGSDGANTSDTQNLFEAARLALGLSRVLGADEARWLNAGDVLHMATEASAQVLGWAGRIGRIAPDYQADLLLLDLTRPEYVPLRDVLAQMVHGESSAAVDCVLVGGRLVVEGGRVLTVDETALRQQAALAAQRLDAANLEGRHLAQALRPWVSAFCCGVARTAWQPQRRLPA